MRHPVLKYQMQRYSVMMFILSGRVCRLTLLCKFSSLCALSSTQCCRIVPNVVSMPDVVHVRFFNVYLCYGIFRVYLYMSAFVVLEMKFLQ